MIELKVFCYQLIIEIATDNSLNEVNLAAAQNNILTR